METGHVADGSDLQPVLEAEEMLDQILRLDDPFNLLVSAVRGLPVRSQL